MVSRGELLKCHGHICNLAEMFECLPMFTKCVKINSIDIDAHHTTLTIIVNDYIAGHIGFHTSASPNLNGNNAIFLIDIDSLFLF